MRLRSPSVIGNIESTSSTCEPFLNPSYIGNGTPKVSAPRTAANLATNQYLDPNAFIQNNSTTQPTYNYKFSIAARTAPLSGLFQPGNYKGDVSLRRSFAISNKLLENSRVSFQVDIIGIAHKARGIAHSRVLREWFHGSATL
jgi:hypothetical protein